MIPRMATIRLRWLVAAAGMALMGAGCGSSTHRARTSSASGPVPAVADASSVGVIRAWSIALRDGDVDAAARYFALPSEFINGGGDVVSIRTEAQARAANATLPCGARLISTSRHGRYISALFRLTDRPGPDAGCGTGAGQLARTNFIIAHGHILLWLRAPDAGGGAGGGGGAPAPSAPPGPVV
jgi:hypothetical protein